MEFSCECSSPAVAALQQQLRQPAQASIRDAMLLQARSRTDEIIRARAEVAACLKRRGDDLLFAQPAGVAGLAAVTTKATARTMPSPVSALIQRGM
jgi:hypothetical protein